MEIGWSVIDVIAEKAFTELQTSTYNKNLPQMISLNLSIPTDMISFKKQKNK